MYEREHNTHNRESSSHLDGGLSEGLSALQLTGTGWSESDKKLLEVQRAIDPSSPEGAEFSAQIQGIFKRLVTARSGSNQVAFSEQLSRSHLGSEAHLDKIPPYFLLSDVEAVGASIYCAGGLKDQPTVVITKGLLSLIQSEDQLAWVLGHELTHLALRNELDVYHSSQGEEILADLASVMTMHAAGYDPREALTVLKLLQEEEKEFGLVGNLLMSISEHGRTVHRISALELALTKMTRDHGGMNRGATPLNLQDSYMNEYHEGVIARALRVSDFATRSSEEQKEMLLDLIPSLTNPARASDFLEAYGLLLSESLEDHYGEADEVWDNLFERLATLPQGQYGSSKSKSLCAASLCELAQLDESESSFWWPKPALLGWMKELGNLCIDLGASDDREEADEVAELILSLGEVTWRKLEEDSKGKKVTFNPYKPLDNTQEQELLRLLYLTPWPLPEGHTLQKLLQWAEESELLRNALHEIGVMHDNLFDLYSAEELVELEASPLTNSYTYERLRSDYIGSRFGDTVEQWYFDNLFTRERGSWNNQRFEELIDLLERDREGEESLKLTPTLLELSLSPYIEKGLKRRFFEIVVSDSRLDHEEKMKLLCLCEMTTLVEEELRVGLAQGVSLERVAPSTLEVFRSIFGYATPTTSKDFDRLLKVMRSIKDLDGVSYHGTSFSSFLAGIETSLYLTCTPNSHLSYKQILKLLKLDAGGGFPEVRPYLCRELLKLSDGGLPLSDLIRVVKAFDTAGWFGSDPNTEKQLLNQIEDKILLLEPSAQTKAIVEFLAGERIKDPEVRSRSISRWCSLWRNRLGLDDGSEEYVEPVQEALSELDEGGYDFWHDSISVNEVDRHEMKRYLSLLTVAQGPLALLLEPDLRITGEELSLSQPFGAAGQVLMTLLEKDQKLNREVLDFLASALTPSSVARLFNALEEKRESLERSFSLYPERLEFFNRVTPTSLELLHRNFWAAPFHQRIAMVTPLLKNEHDQDEVFDWFSDRVLAVGGDSEIAKRFIRAYIAASPEYERTVLLSALMVSAEKRTDSAPLRIGEALRSLAENLEDPAFVKVCQAIHSSPTTPRELRADIGLLKGLGNIPSRRELFDLYKESVPQEVQDIIGHLGPVVGAGSYWIIVEATKKDGERIALGLLRRNATEKAKEGFRRLEGALNSIAADDEIVNEAMLSAARRAILQARRMVDLETSSEVGAKQFAIARELYRGIRVKVEDTSFAVRTAHWQRWGEGFKIMEFSSGTPFNRLPEGDYKRKVAKAYLTVELTNILRGGHFDHDRHGDQLLVDEESDILWIIDTGAMRLKSPEVLDKQKTALFLFDLSEALRSSRDFGATVLEEFQKAASGNEEDEMLLELQRGLLALADFQRELSPSDFGEAMYGALRSGRVDPEISQIFARRYVEEYGLLDAIMVGLAMVGPSKGTVSIRWSDR